jgi:pyruvate formate lyase activating enzyme
MRWTPALLGEATARGTRCRLCPHACVLDAGQVGACKVRRGGPEGGLETATFASSVMHVDAVERKPFFHYRPGTQTVTLAAPGCSFRCDYCINFRLSQYGRDDESAWGADAVDVDGVLAKAASLGGSVALSYSEPSLAPELTLELASRGRAEGVEVVWKSNGFLTPEAVALCAPAVAAVNIDLKSADEVAHRRLTGGSVKPVIEAIKAFVAHGTWVEISTPLIPDVTDPAPIAEIIAEIGTYIPWHLVRFSPAYRMGAHVPTPPVDLAAAAAVGRSAGLKYIYVERALGAEGRDTRCPYCQTIVVRRGIWSFEESLLALGDCPQCGAAVEGRW